MTGKSTPGALEAKSIVVIGGTSGLGLSAACALMAAGGRVLAVGLPETVAAARERLGDTARVIGADATRPETAQAAIDEAISVFGGFDGLYHVAGGSGRRFGDGPLHELTDEGWQATMELNVTSVFYSNRAAARCFLARKSGGSILNLSSVLAWSPAPRFFNTHAYTAAKAAIIGLTRASAAYYAPNGIRFNVLAPGLTATPMSRRAQADPAIQRYVKTKQPLDRGRMASPADLDAAAVYFLSDAARFTTGQVLAVDGGWCVSEGQIPAES